MISHRMHRRAASDSKETNMLKTMTALSLGFLLAGAAAANAGDASLTLRYELHAHRAVHHQTVDSRASALAPAPAGARASRPQSDLPSAEWDFSGGDAGYTWEPYGWRRTMK
jgi:hypothetical protein